MTIFDELEILKIMLKFPILTMAVLSAKFKMERGMVKEYFFTLHQISILDLGLKMLFTDKAFICFLQDKFMMGFSNLIKNKALEHTIMIMVMLFIQEIGIKILSMVVVS